MSQRYLFFDGKIVQDEDHRPRVTLWDKNAGVLTFFRLFYKDFIQSEKEKETNLYKEDIILRMMKMKDASEWTQKVQTSKTYYYESNRPTIDSLLFCFN